MDQFSDLKERVEEYRDRITRIGGDPDLVCLLAVTKGFGAEAVTAAIDAGLSAVGENYAQEIRTKHAELREQGHRQPWWHFIGQLQRNKVRQLAPIVHVWETVDSPELAGEIAKRAPSAAVFVQVNLSDEPGRGGCRWDDAPRLVDHARQLGLDVRGLMGVGPLGEPEDARPGFRRLAALAGRLELADVSMGMTADFDIAIQEGATIVRLGSALFGPRPARRPQPLG